MPEDVQDRTERAGESATRMNQGAFLAAYAKSARISRAADAAGIGRQTHYDWLAHDTEYRAEFVKAKELAMQTLEDEATRRALGDGCEPSDRLMEFLLKGGRPEVYRERQSIEHSGPGGKPLLDLTAVDEFIRRCAANPK